MNVLTQYLVPIYSSIWSKVYIYKYTYIEKFLQCVRVSYYEL